MADNKEVILQSRIEQLEAEKAELIEFIELLPEYDVEIIMYYREKLLKKHGVEI